MTSPADWSDDVAAQIMVIAFTRKNAREIIAQVLQLTYTRGQEAGVNEARNIYTEAFADLFPETQQGRTQ